MLHEKLVMRSWKISIIEEVHMESTSLLQMQNRYIFKDFTVIFAGKIVKLQVCW
jgi:hypothetical protein